MDSRLELLHPAPPGAAAFVLVAEAAGDTRFVPYVRSHRIWEPAETLALLRMLRAGMCVIDVGAHIGYYSVLLAQRVGAHGNVQAFEPEPRNLRLLRANLVLNGCDKVATHALAVTEERGRARLHLSADNLGDHRLQAVSGRATIEVETASLDEIIGDAHVDLVKIDTQGAEPRVLAGMRLLIERNRAHLACMLEFAPGLLARDGIDTAAFAGQLMSLQARAYHMAMQGRQVTLRALSPLAENLASLATELASRNEEDASSDLLVFFSAAAENAWLARFRG